MAGQVEEVIEGLKSIQLDLETRAIVSRPAPSRGEIMALGYVTGMIGHHIEHLSNMDEAQTTAVEIQFTMIEKALRAARGTGDGN